MLILMRRVGEVLRIGEDIQLVVLGVKGNQVRLGVIAPADVPVHRQEIYERIQAEKGAKGEAPASIPPGAVGGKSSEGTSSRKSSAPVESGEMRPPRLTRKNTDSKG